MLLYIYLSDKLETKVIIDSEECKILPINYTVNHGQLVSISKAF